MNNNEAGKDYRKMMFVFLAIVIVVIVGVFAWEIYKEESLAWQASELQKDIERIREQKNQKLMADTYGGKTPQETLKMYIDAVEEGDYKLASKYFIEEKREVEMMNLKMADDNKNISNLIKSLREAIENAGSYSANRDGFAIRNPILIDFIMYPNGIWKITEI